LKSQLSGYTFSPGGSPPRSCRLTCCARFVARLFLSALVTYDALIIAPGWTRFGFRHALLAAMFAALVLRTLQIVFFRHRDQILFSRLRARPVTINAIPRRWVPPAEDKENPPREPRKSGEVSGVETSNR